MSLYYSILNNVSSRTRSWSPVSRIPGRVGHSRRIIRYRTSYANDKQTRRLHRSGEDGSKRSMESQAQKSHRDHDLMGSEAAPKAPNNMDHRWEPETSP